MNGSNTTTDHRNNVTSNPDRKSRNSQNMANGAGSSIQFQVNAQPISVSNSSVEQTATPSTPSAANSAVAAARQKRSYVSSKLGCRNCRKRFKKRCDETLPQCSLCIQNKVRCSYLDEDDEVINRIKRAHAIIADHKLTLQNNGESNFSTGPHFGKFKLKSSRSKKNSNKDNAIKSVQIKSLTKALNGNTSKNFPIVVKPAAKNEAVQRLQKSKGLPGCSIESKLFLVYEFNYNTKFEIPKRFNIYNYTSFDYSVNDACFQGFMQDIWFYYLMVEATKSLPVCASLLDCSIGYLKANTVYSANHKVLTMELFKKIPYHYKDVVFNSIAKGLKILDSYKCMDNEGFWNICNNFNSEDIEKIYQISTRLMYTTIIIHNAALLIPDNALQTSCFYGGSFSLMCSLQKVYIRFSHEYKNKTFSPKTKIPVSAIKSIFLPNYNLECLQEILNEVTSFYHAFIAHNADERISFQFNNLTSFINKLLSRVRYAKDTSKVNNFPMEMIYEIIYDWLRIAPSEMVVVKCNRSMKLVHKIFYTYWIALCYALNNIFPECVYFFGSTFSTCSNIYGFDYNYYGKDFDDGVTAEYLTAGSNEQQQQQQQNYKVSQLRIHMNYAIRIIAFFNMRTNLFLNNLVLINPYPHEFFERGAENRLFTRKCNNLKEVQVTTFKKKFTADNFIAIDLEKERFATSTKNVTFSKLSYPRHDLVTMSNYIHGDFKNHKMIDSIISKIKRNENYANNFINNSGSPNHPFSVPINVNKFDRYYNKYNSSTDLSIVNGNNIISPSSASGSSEIDTDLVDGTPASTAPLASGGINGASIYSSTDLEAADEDFVDLLLPLSTNGLSIGDFNPLFHNHEDERLNLFYKNANSLNFDGTEIEESVSDLYTDYYHDRNEVLNQLFFERAA